ncbi:hypothetical protein F7725_002149 [Dissostichus mawsoni]|uniref:Pre-mRNA-splicing factor CWC22 homolog n=1 Tax=Dissostichus mawsoni TaxID=36200 RepID=A0A7J5Y1U9_DISMA|nr:hypothetical protein F7725_002149 [Dissostichus mawsoni]
MDSPSRSPSPIPEMKEQSGPSEDEASPAAEKPKQEGPIEKSPEPQTKPSREASPAARSRSGSRPLGASGGPASGGPASGGPASSSSDDSTSSDDEDEHQGALRRLRSSVAQIKRSKSKSRSRDRSISRDRSRSGEGDRSRSKSRDRSRERDRSRSRGRERSRSRDRDRGRYDRGRYDRDRYDVRRDDRDARFDRRPNRDAEWEQRRRGRSGSPSADREPGTAEEPPVKKKKEEIDPILTRTGGAYIPPAKLRMMQQQITDKTSLAYQRMSWEALKKSINGLINKVNVANIVFIIQELLQENIVRGRGLLARSMLQAQAASPIFTHVYSAVISIINSKFPQIGELILKRLILSFRRSYRRNIKQQCLTASKFVAHLINQNVAHEVLCLEMLTLLLERPTDDSVEVAIAFLKECGLKLTEVSPRGINAIFERLRNVLHESAIDKRVQYMIEEGRFQRPPVIPEGLDLVDEGEQFTHMLPLDDEYNIDDILNVFKMDPDFLENEEKYKTIKREILDEGSSDSGEDGDGSGDDEDDEEENAEPTEEEKIIIYDQTEINLVAFRRTIYLAIQSSLDFEECAHKLIKMDFPDSQTKELCNMILDCCAQQRTYEKFFGLLAGRFCLLKKEYMESFEGIFAEQYDTIHRLETNKLRNVARLFAHLLYTDSVPWSVLECVRMSEETTTSSSRIFVKILFQELCAYMGLPRLNQRLKDATLQPFFEGLFPRDNPRNTRFAINFFTSIGLGGLTDELREHLKNAPKIIMTQNQQVESSDSSDSSSSSSSSSSSDSSSDSDSSDSDSSSSSDSDSKQRKKKKRKTQIVEKKKKKGEDKKKKNKKDKQSDKKRAGRKNDEEDEDSDDEKKAKKHKKGRAQEVEERAREIEAHERALEAHEHAREVEGRAREVEGRERAREMEVVVERWRVVGAVERWRVVSVHVRWRVAIAHVRWRVAIAHGRWRVVTIHVRKRSVHVRAPAGTDETKGRKRSGSRRRRGGGKWTVKANRETERGRERGTAGGRETEREGGTERLRIRERGRESERSRGIERGIKRTETGTEMEKERRGGGGESLHLSS